MVVRISHVMTGRLCVGVCSNKSIKMPDVHVPKIVIQYDTVYLIYHLVYHME